MPLDTIVQMDQKQSMVRVNVSQVLIVPLDHLHEMEQVYAMQDITVHKVQKHQ